MGVTTPNQRVPILRCYGVNEQGHSVAIFIHGFTPYGFFALPPGYELTDTMHLEAIRAKLESQLQMAVRGNAAATAKVVGVEYVSTHKSIMGYESPHTQFLKVFVSVPTLIPTLKRIMEEGMQLPGIESVDDDDSGLPLFAPSFAPFECNVPFVLRFMVDREIAGAGWMTLPGKTYQIRAAARKETHCQVSFGVRWQSYPCTTVSNLEFVLFSD